MLLVSNKFTSETVTIEDSSPESTTRINIVFEKGQVAKVEPDSTLLFLGDG